ncbi:MAG: hypothetical protein KC656_33680 [Myxococcales bacterium]|nr:hypothetical protein [Myxococcales bacterium]
MRGRRLIVDHGGRIAGYDAAGESVWELSGGGIAWWDDRLVRVVDGGLQVLDPVDGAQVGGFPLDAGGPLAGLGSCLVALPDVGSGRPVVCAGPSGTVWTAPLQAAGFDVDPVVADVDGDGRKDLVAVTSLGDVVVLDADGRLLAHGEGRSPPVGPPVVVAIEGRPTVIVAGQTGVQAWRLGSPLPPVPRAPRSERHAGFPVIPREVRACGHFLDRNACMVLAEAQRSAGDLAGAAAAWERACLLGAGEACAELALDGALVSLASDAFWEAGCRLGQGPVCEGWLGRVPEARRAGAARLACSSGYATACGYTAPPAAPARTREARAGPGRG